MSMQQPRRKFHSIPLRKSAAYQARHTTSGGMAAITRRVPQTGYEDEDDEAYLPTRIPNSAVRYRDTQGNDVIMQGNRRYVMHREPPPPRKHPQQSRRGISWLFIFGTGMIVMVLAVMLMNWIAGAWQEHQLDGQYGNPRTYQTDAVVGHGGDSAAHPTHFIFENLHGRVIIIELPAGDISKAIIYAGPQLFGSDPTGEPVTGSFETINGKVEMIVHIGDNQPIIYVNNGTKFVPEGNAP